VMYVTATIGGQRFGLPISRVQDVFVAHGITPVPLADAEVAGLINMRGRIVTILEMRRLLGLGLDEPYQSSMAIGVSRHGESYGLLVDEVGDVLTLPDAAREPAPANLDRQLAGATAGVYRLDDGLMMVLDVDRVVGGAPCTRLM
jgi:purine-binding chemotaxis protein CheW